MDTLEHIGQYYNSGRYPRGSGENPYQRSLGFLDTLDSYRKKGMDKNQIAKELGISVRTLNEQISAANAEKKQHLYEAGKFLTEEKGMSTRAAAKELGIPEATLRRSMNESAKKMIERDIALKNHIAKRIDEIKYLDISENVELQLGISRNKLREIVRQMVDSGEYHEHHIWFRKVSNPEHGQDVRVLTKEADWNVVKENQGNIKSFDEFSEDRGRTTRGIKPPKSVDPDRVTIAYDEDGGTNKDGLIEIRRGVSDLDMGNSRYAQVRIQVGDKNYLKGMAVYADDLPDGVDIRFNTNKSRSKGKMGVMKELENDPENPFGSTIARQSGALNIVREQGEWADWSKTFSTQFLSKQPTPLIKDRINAQKKINESEFDEINSLTHPTVKKYLLEKYADELQTRTKELKVQSLTGTRGHVILPFTDINPKEIYAPNYKDGDSVVLLRYPHAGRFELAQLTVNNKLKSPKKTIDNAPDAVGIHPSVAQKLSGADFDGDTVYVIPNNNKRVKVRDSLKELENFDPQMYKVEPIKNAQGEIINKTIKKGHKNKEMGVVSNLITDMTLQDASDSELARAVKHSMVVIDSEKHNLDYKRSAKDNNIAALQKKYQKHIGLDGKEHMGASTLISRVEKQVESDYDTYYSVNPKTGRPTPVKTPPNKKFDMIDTVSDAHLLSRGTNPEKLYADYINETRVLRKKAVDTFNNTRNKEWNRAAEKEYAPEVESLKTKLNNAKLNSPRERRAQIIAKDNFYKSYNPEMDKEERKKLSRQVLAAARASVRPEGYQKGDNTIKITPKEWEAIDSGAISSARLTEIFRYADMTQIKQYAMPNNKQAISSAKEARAKTMLASGKTYAEVSKSLGISVSSLHNMEKE